MKRIIFCLFLLGLVSGFFSCTKEMSYENPNGDGDSTIAGNFKALINNVQWVASPTTEGATIFGGIINITGISSDNKQISITLNGTTIGQYILDQTSVSVLAYVDGGSSNTNPLTTNQGTDSTLAGGNVQVTIIDTVNKTISGYFQCKVYRDEDSQQQIITSGSFTEIPYVTSLPPAAADDTFHVKVAGVEWFPPSIAASASAGKFVIAAAEADGSRTIGLVMPDNLVPGTYDLDILGGTYYGEYSPDTSTLMVSVSGTLTILEIGNRRIKGNFQFLASQGSLGGTSVMLTEGYFSVSY